MSWQILQGDCIEQMAELEAASVDAVVCDPPYGIGFMGHEWDQPGEFGPIGPDEDVPLQGGKKRRSQPAPASGNGHVRERRAKRDGVRLGMDERGEERDHTKCRDRSGAMHAGRYDLSLTANQRYQAWCEAWAREAFRVLKPGGHLLASCGTRTYHRLAAGVEDAGFEVRDSILWLYGSGFPKSLNVSKAIDMAAGADREVVGTRRAGITPSGGLVEHGVTEEEKQRPVTAPATPEAAQWEGWGTALKPTHEPIVVARKPLIGTVAENVLEHGTGGINVDACRIAGQPRATGTKADDASAGSGNVYMGVGSDGAQQQSYDENLPAGRWPANVVLSHLEECEVVGVTSVNSNGHHPGARGKGGLSTYGHSGRGDLPERRSAGEHVEAWDCAPGCPVAELDAQSGVLTSGFMAAGTEHEGLGYRGRLGSRVRNDTHGDSGGASRFFYRAKTSRGERNAGLEGFEKKPRAAAIEPKSRQCNQCGSRTKKRGEPWPTCGHDDWVWVETSVDPHHGGHGNSHPTVKPINLMRWLCRLVTPPGGLILDPFLGSGSTGCAAVLEGFDFVGIERESEYVAIAEARIAFWAQHEGREVEDVLGIVARSERARKARDETGQLGLAGISGGGGSQMTVDDVLADIEKGQS